MKLMESVRPKQITRLKKLLAAMTASNAAETSLLMVQNTITALENSEYEELTARAMIAANDLWKEFGSGIMVKDHNA